MATAGLIHEPWDVIGNPCIGNDYGDSFNCQFSSVFKVPGKEFYTALGDRWMFGSPIETAAYGQMNTALARHVWLPIQWTDGKSEIKWLDQWSPADYPAEEAIDPIEVMKKQMAPFAASIMKRKAEEKVADE